MTLYRAPVIQILPSDISLWGRLRKLWKGHKDRAKRLEQIYPVILDGLVVALFGLERKGYKHASVPIFFSEHCILLFTGFVWLEDDPKVVSFLTAYNKDEIRRLIFLAAIENVRRNGFKRKRVSVVSEVTLLGVTKAYARRIGDHNKCPQLITMGIGSYNRNVYDLVQKELQDPDFDISDSKAKHFGTWGYFWVNPDLHPELSAELLAARNYTGPDSTKLQKVSIGYVWPRSAVNTVINTITNHRHLDKKDPDLPWDSEERWKVFNWMRKPTETR